MICKQVVFSAFAIVVTAASASGWEFGMVGDNTFWTGTRDVEDKTQLVFFCNQAMPGIIQLQVFTDEPGPTSPVGVELFFQTSEGRFGPIIAKASASGGMLTVATTGMDLAAMNAAQSVYAETGSVELTYYESSWRYPGVARSDAFGAMLDACG